MKANSIATLRLVLLGLTGVACFLFAALALWWWGPAAMGLGSTAVLFAVAWLAGDRQVGMAYDELNAEITRRAAAGAYWISLALFFPFAAGMAWQVMAPGALTAAFGMAMGGIYLIRFVWLDLRLR